MLIEVTQADIDGGTKFDAWKCPVARAIKRHLASGWTVTVTVFSILISHDSAVIFNIKTPPTVETFIRSFDLGSPVKPFSFDMEELCLST